MGGAHRNAALQKVVAVAVILSLLLSFFPASLLAQDPPLAPPDTSGLPTVDPVDDSALAAGIEPAVIDATADIPFSLVSTDVSSYSAPDPAVFWMTESYCAPTPPRAASEEEAAAASAGIEGNEVTPDAIDAATPFRVRRTNFAGYEWRELQYRPDNTGGNPWNCAGQYRVNSNIAANQTHVYWVDADGLKRLPVTANTGDTPELVDDTWRANTRVQLKMVDTLLFGTFNNTATGGPFGTLGWSSLDYHDTATGVSKNIKFNFGFNANFNAPDYDGTYVYFKIDGLLKRINLDSTDEQPIAGNVGPYASDGRRLSFCLIGQPCTFTHYIFYSKGDGVIYRHSLINGTIAGIQTRANRQILALLPSAIPSDLVLFGARRLFWVESYFVPDGGPFATGTYYYSLMRSTFSGGAAIDNLYNISASSLNAITFSNMTSNGKYLLWQQNGAIQRLPTDAAALPKVDMTITGSEITQGVQNDDNSVRLIQGRNTYLRVFVDAAGSDVSGVTMRLSSNKGGGQLFPINGPHLTVKDNSDRKQVNDSFLFLLPNAWTYANDLVLYASLNPFQVPMEPTYANNSWTSPSFAFSEAYPLRLILYEANYLVGAGASQVGWIVTDVSSNAAWMRRALPIAEDGLQYSVRSINGGFLLGNHVLQTAKTCTDMAADVRSLCASDWVIAKLNAMASDPSYGIPGNVYMYGLINDGGAFPRGQAGGRAGAGPTGTHISYSGSPPNQVLNYSDYGYYTGHEIAHMLGRPHPSPNSDDPATDKVVEGCGHSRSDNSFPYANALIGNADGKIRGFDRSHTSASGWGKYLVLDDSNAYDMMSYCGDSQLRWPSPYTWEGIYQWLKSHQALASGVSAASVQGGDYVGIFGTIYPGKVIVHSVTRQSSGVPSVADPAGEYIVRMLGSGGTLLDSFRFSGNPLSETGEPFSLMIPLAGGTTSLQIVRASGGAALFTQTVSANAPVVTNVALPGAPNPVDGTVNVSWSVADADGGALTADLYYTYDDGATWQPVTLGIVGNSTPVDTTALGGGTGRFRVVVSDGINQGSAESAPITMAVKAPKIAISSPTEGQSFEWKQMILLEGYAWDTIDGGLDGGSMVWSNQYGVIGNGATLATDALPTGQNVLTLVATNGAGLSASKQVTITIGDLVGALPATGAAAPASLGFQFQTPASDAQSKSIALSNFGEAGGLSWSASASDPWLVATPASGSSVPATLLVTVTPASLVLNQQYSAYVRITFASSAVDVQTLDIPVGVSIGNSFVSEPLNTSTLRSTFLPTVSK